MMRSSGGAISILTTFGAKVSKGIYFATSIRGHVRAAQASSATNFLPAFSSAPPALPERSK